MSVIEGYVGTWLDGKAGVVIASDRRTPPNRKRDSTTQPHFTTSSAELSRRTAPVHVASSYVYEARSETLEHIKSTRVNSAPGRRAIPHGWWLSVHAPCHRKGLIGQGRAVGSSRSGGFERD
jgi:hypothetical protein